MSQLQDRARRSLAEKGVKNPPPSQVVQEMKRLEAMDQQNDGFLAGFRRTVFGE